MTKPPTAGIFAIFFAFFGIYFLHIAEARAETAFSPRRLAHYPEVHRAESTQPIYGKAAHNPDLDQWHPWAFTIPQDIEHPAVASSPAIEIAFAPHFNAKNFYIRTGLSPPRVFV